MFFEISCEKNLPSFCVRAKIKIIGFGDGDNSKMYYEKGIVSKLISIAPKEIGKKAVCEFFEYKNNGYANSYVIADVEVHKQVKK